MRSVVLLLGVVSALTTLVVLVRTFLSSAKAKRESEGQLQLYSRLIDKFGTAAELVDYLKSDAGTKLITAPAAEVGGPYRRVLASAQAGIVLTFVGLAFLILRTLDGAMESVWALRFLGGTILALGLGFVSSAALTWSLARSWGLVDGKGGDPPREG